MNLKNLNRCHQEQRSITFGIVIGFYLLIAALVHAAGMVTNSFARSCWCPSAHTLSWLSP